MLKLWLLALPLPTRPYCHARVLGMPSPHPLVPQVAAALRKIAGHIGHPKKFSKASQLLRELLAQVGACGAAAQQRAPLLFYYSAICLQAAPKQHASCHVVCTTSAPLPPRFTAHPLPPRVPACLQGAVRPAHGPLLFSALKAAMRDPAQASRRSVQNKDCTQALRP